MIKKQKFKLKEAALEFKKMRFDMILHKEAEQKVIDLIKISNDEAKVRALYGSSHTGKSNFLKNSNSCVYCKTEYCMKVEVMLKFRQKFVSEWITI